MKQLERRINTGSEVKLESRADGQPKVITVTGAVCYDGTPNTEFVLWEYDSERAVERILPGAFDKALSRPDDVRGLFNHDANQVLGRTTSGTMRLSANGSGLYYEITPGNTTVANDVKEHLNRKDVSGSSIAFTVDEERWTETKSADGKYNVLREILSISLADVGPVTFPAYTSTTAGVRAVGDPEEAKRSLAAFRAKQKRDDAIPLHPSTKQAIITAAEGVTTACASLISRLTGVITADVEVLAALAAADLAVDQCDQILDCLVGDDDEADEAAATANADRSHDNRDLLSRLAQIE